MNHVTIQHPWENAKHHPVWHLCWFFQGFLHFQNQKREIKCYSLCILLISLHLRSLHPPDQIGLLQSTKSFPKVCLLRTSGNDRKNAGRTKPPPHQGIQRSWVHGSYQEEFFYSSWLFPWFRTLDAFSCGDMKGDIHFPRQYLNVYKYLYFLQ